MENQIYISIFEILSRRKTTKNNYNMKKFFKFAAVAAIAAMFVSCTEKPGPEPEKPNNQEPETPKVEITENIAFTLEVTEVEIDKAKVKVEHNGTTKDTWYAFATTDTDVNAAITAKVAELTADGGKISGLKKNTSTTITVRSLEQDTDYTFIAFAITPEGELYGTAASTAFKTEKEEEVPPTPPAPEGMTVNPNWTVTYIGDYEQGGKVYDNVVVVETTDTNPFFVTAWPVDYYEELGIEAIVEEEIKAWEEMLAQYPGATWNDIVYTESILAQVSIDPEYGTKWYAMAIGCDTNGKATGLYALSEVIDLENLGGGDDSGDEEEPTAEYAAWIGDWTFTGANGVAWPITFSKGKANQSFIMTGWEGQTDLPVVIEWDGENGFWAATMQSIGTYEFDGGLNGDIWFVAFSGPKNFYAAEGVPAFIGGHDENGNKIAIGYEAQDNNGNPIPFDKAGFLAQIEGQWYTFTGVTDFPTFPITITPATKATTCAVKEFKGGKKTINSLTPKTFNTFSICEKSLRTF